ncbi:D-alanyl-D-alanine carboxypeptidase family protein [Bacillus sp. T3]|uniref:D-alanyl-D-alanine carboxypeptidase family protein n=1 Tax=Bacillus sp. T3 TaxID=467262 RepID=UPI002982174C|nr:D-alanyl-D-alanine carboxypeptidase family protein [Bacillus sp. T3]
MRKIFITLLIVLSFCTAQAPVLAQHQDDLQLKSEAAVLMDSQTGAILYGKNATEKMYPASLTKIATAIYAIEKGNLNDIVTVSENAYNTEGTKVYLEIGEKVPLHHLLQGLLINSGNDAAVAIAEHLDGNVENFSVNLNEYLKDKIGVKDTHFVNPHGLYDENHYTTAADLAKITSYAMKNKDFKEIFGTKELTWDGLTWDTTLITHHQMLKGEIPYPGVTGGKTGFVNESKQTLATTVDNGQLQFTAIVLKTDYKRDIYNDTKQLFDYGFQHFKRSQLAESDTFKIQDKVFKPRGLVLITEPIEGVKYEVSNKGMLRVQTPENETIQEIQLVPNQKQLKKQKVIPSSENNAPFKSMNVFFGTIAVLATGAAFSVRKK